MIIDISKLKSGYLNIINIDDNIILDEELLFNSRIKELDSVHLTGHIKINITDDYELKGTLKGEMSLEDDLTLELIKMPFSIEIEEVIGQNEMKISEKSKNNQNILDITSILWQNILVEVPIRVTDKKVDDLSLSGEGWKVVTEATYNNSSTTSLGELLNRARKE